MELARTVFDFDMITEFLEFEAPAIEALIGTFEVHEPLECDVIGDDSEFGTVEIGAEFLNSPDNGETFEFGCGISGFGVAKRAGKKNDGVFDIVVIFL